jgi:hypothetical protein
VTTPATPITVTQYGVQDRSGSITALPPNIARDRAEQYLAQQRAKSGRTLHLVLRTVVTTPWTATEPQPHAATRDPAPQKTALCAHNRVLGQEACPGCDAACTRPHRADPATIRPPWAGKALLRCRRCGWHPAATHHTNADQYGPLPNPRTEGQVTR